MFGRLSLLIVILYYAICFYSDVNCSDQFFIKSASPKKIPLIGKRNRNSNADFEKFFLKASKSVPRIGRTETGLEQVLFDIVFNVILIDVFREPLIWTLKIHIRIRNMRCKTET